MKKKYLSKIFFIIIWFLTFVFASFWGYENPEKVEILKSYLNHLIKTNEILASMIISLHNVNFYQEFMEKIRRSIDNGKFNSFYKKYINRYN